VGAVLLIASSRMFGPLEFAAPAQKFVRAALAWLVVAGLLMAFEPLHLAAIGQPFSHAFTGAIRHAATVGFISQMILGVGMHVAARMTDLPRDLERPLWMTFWLLNIGNAGRVGLEIATDYTQAAFLPMGVTGFVELTALIFWAAYVLRTMFRRWSPAHVG
ncbi:MAG TPA: NnrS family protein, partial [Fimbriimonadaceae bacterium]|nr:NnrS family protein [Fimbriimonadaceae bacterium]